METTARRASKLNHIIERPNLEHHIKTRIDLGLQPKLPKECWHFSRQCMKFIERHEWCTRINSTPCYEYYD